MKASAEQISYYLNRLNSCTKHEYVVVYGNGSCGLYIKYKSSGVDSVVTGLTKGQMITVLLALINLDYFENRQGEQ